MKKPKGLSWAGHRSAIAMAKPFVGGDKGGGQAAYRVAAKQIMAIESVLSRPKAEVERELRASMAADGKGKGRRRG